MSEKEHWIKVNNEYLNMDRMEHIWIDDGDESTVNVCMKSGKHYNLLSEGKAAETLKFLEEKLRTIVFFDELSTKEKETNPTLQSPPDTLQPEGGSELTGA